MIALFAISYNDVMFNISSCAINSTNNTDTFQFVKEIGNNGSNDGQFYSPTDIALGSDENIYVIDTGNFRVQKFDSNGKFILMWGSNGTEDGQFRHPTSIAVDSKDFVYVGDSVGNIQKFDSNGTFIHKWNSYTIPQGLYTGPESLKDTGKRTFIPVDIVIDKNGYMYIADYQGKIIVLDHSGYYITVGSYGITNGQFQIPEGIAIDSDNNVYVASFNNYSSKVQKFDSNGYFISNIGSNGIGHGQFLSPTGIATDSDNNVYVIDSTTNKITKFDSNGHYIAEIESAGTKQGQFQRPHGIAVDLNGKVYVVDSGNNRIEIFAPSDNKDLLIGPPHINNNQNTNPPNNITSSENKNTISKLPYGITDSI